MHNFVYLAQLRSQEFSCERNFGGGRAPWLRHWRSAANADICYILCQGMRLNTALFLVTVQEGKVM